MPYGKPRTEAERKARHKRIYGDLKNFPKERGKKIRNILRKRI